MTLRLARLPLKRYSILKEQVGKLDSSKLNLKSEILKFLFIEKGKNLMSEDKKGIVSDLIQYKDISISISLTI